MQREKVYEAIDSERYHILPINDTQPHTESETCQCNPSVEIINKATVIVHNSFDGRELKEALRYSTKKNITLADKILSLNKIISEQAERLEQCEKLSQSVMLDIGGNNEQ